MTSYTSTTSSHSSTSTTSSSPSFTASRPVSFTSSSALSHRSSISSTTSNANATTTSNPYSSCACPSWPSGSSFFASHSRARPSAYVSDEDLFGGDADNQQVYLSEPPPPPRPAEAYLQLARPLLPPVVQFERRPCSTAASARKKRRSSCKAKV